MRPFITLFALVIVALIADFARAQGYYRNTVRRNPITGQLEIVPNTQGYSRWSGPGGSGFNGAAFNPNTGTLAQTAVRRNAATGQREILNEYYNPWTGARLQSASRFNPVTGRYETLTYQMPPTRSVPSEEQEAPSLDTIREQPQGTGTRTSTRPKPKVIETPMGGTGVSPVPSP
jgi:hypothetical protein